MGVDSLVGEYISVEERWDPMMTIVPLSAVSSSGPLMSKLVGERPMSGCGGALACQVIRAANSCRHPCVRSYELPTAVGTPLDGHPTTIEAQAPAPSSAHELPACVRHSHSGACLRPHATATPLTPIMRRSSRQRLRASSSPQHITIDTQ